MFFCEDCIEGIKIVPKLLKKVSQMVAKFSPQNTIHEDTIAGKLMER